MDKKKIDYSDSGIRYDIVDPFKRLSQKLGKETSVLLKRHGFKEVDASRGESAYVWEEKDSYRAFVVEGLGTKNLIADAIAKKTGKNFYDKIAQDAVAMAINDLIVVGAKPVTLNAYFAVGDSRWFADKKRANNLVIGWAKACKKAGVAWGGGETAILPEVIEKERIDLAEATIGIIKPKKRLVLGNSLKKDDAIVLIESSGIHANGLSLARKISYKLPKGYSTKLPDGSTYGETLLEPTHIYSPFIQNLLESGVSIHYMVHITGHGWRKLMRASQQFTYRFHTIPPLLPIFRFIQKHSRMSDKEMFATFNMGAGFALYLPQKDTAKVLQISKTFRFKSWLAGIVEKGPKRVIISPKKIIFEGDSLQIRRK